MSTDGYYEHRRAGKYVVYRTNSFPRYEVTVTADDTRTSTHVNDGRKSINANSFKVILEGPNLHEEVASGIQSHQEAVQRAKTELEQRLV